MQAFAPFPPAAGSVIDRRRRSHLTFLVKTEHAPLRQVYATWPRASRFAQVHHDRSEERCAIVVMLDGKPYLETPPAPARKGDIEHVAMVRI